MNQAYKIDLASFQGGEIAASVLEEVLRRFRKEGLVVLENVFDPEKIKKLHDQFISDYSQYLVNKNHEDALRVGDRRFQVTLNVEGELNSPDFYANPLVFQIIEELLEPGFIIDNINCVASLPGAKETHIHRDGMINRKSPLRFMTPAFAIGMLVPLVEINEINGNTRYWPKSHLSSMDREVLKKSSDFVDPNLKEGSCMLMDYRLYHSGRPSKSEKERPLVYCTYCNPWYFDATNFKIQAPLLVDDANWQLIPKKYQPLFIRKNIDMSKNYKQLAEGE